MRLLKAEADKIHSLISRLDEGTIDGRKDVTAACEQLRRWFDRRESPLIHRFETIRDRQDDDPTGQAVVAEAKTVMLDALEAIADSGYIGTNLKMPVKRPRGRPVSVSHRPMNPHARKSLTKRAYRFLMTEDMSAILDNVHKPPLYKITMYEGFTAETAISVVGILLKAAENKESEGWVSSDPTWRGAFQNGVYRRFRLEQIERGTKKNGHNGEWRLYTDGEFDIKSSVGRFRFRAV